MLIYDKIIKKIKEKEFEEELQTRGIAVSGLSYRQAPTHSRFFLCLVRALLIFFAAFGTVGCMTSPFDINIKLYLVIPAGLLICTLVAFIYYNKITFYAGYIAFFIAFSVSIFSLFLYANSGFQAYTNIVFQEYSDYFRLSSVQESTEFIGNRELTVSVAMIFVIAILAILLNIAISGYMSLVETFLLTFPLIQIGLYIDRKPATIYLIMLLSVYITVAILGRSSHYKAPVIGKDSNDFLTKTKKKNGKIISKYHSYISDGGSMLVTSLYSVIVCSIFMIMSLSFFYSDTGSTKISNKLKNTTDEYVKIYIQNGFWGFLDRYSATGGLSEGKLGGVGSVRPDYQTDLIVTYVPEIFDSIYLKAYIGTTYKNNSFVTEPTDEEILAADSLANYYCLADTVPYSGTPSKMKITLVDSSSKYNYMPYYGVSMDEYNLGDTDEYTLSYLPYRYQTSYTTENKPSDSFEKNVYQTYLDVPDDIKKCLDDFLFDSDAFKYSLDFTNATDEEQQQYALLVAGTIKNYFYREYPYTMAPGATPRYEDFVQYFLTTQKRGYCAHFAASSTLLLREMGIPARYVEGYMVSISNISEATAISRDIDGWVGNPDSMTLTDTGLIEVEVTDGSAHAWTEIYINGYGWIPYDFTPPSSDDTVNTFNFTSLLSGLLITGQNNSVTENTVGGEDKNYNFDFSRSFNFVGTPLIILSLLLMTGILVYIFYKPVKLEIMIAVTRRKKQYSRSLTLYYQKMLMRYCIIFNCNHNITVRDLTEQLLNTGHITQKEKDWLTQNLNRAIYSGEQIDKETYDKCILLLRNSIRKTQKK